MAEVNEAPEDTVIRRNKPGTKAKVCIQRARGHVADPQSVHTTTQSPLVTTLSFSRSTLSHARAYLIHNHQDLFSWPDQALEDMETSLALEQYIQQVSVQLLSQNVNSTSIINRVALRFSSSALDRLSRGVAHSARPVQR
jgi:hypothetical protein